MKKRLKRLENKLVEYQEEEINDISLKMDKAILEDNYHSDYSDWEKVKIARDPKRPTAQQYIDTIFDEFIELHGDRYYGDDKAIIGGIGLLNNIPVTIIGVQKGLEADENIKRNFGMPHPEGYRKAMRLMEQANKFRRPIITFINTPGAYPGFGAEERGQGQAIASNLVGMMDLKVPIISIIIGEGGSGGALALAVANQVWMLENSIYSILTPEGFASILYKDASLAEDITSSMKITSDALLQMGIIDHVVAETKEGINENLNEVCLDIKNTLIKEITRMKTYRASAIKKQRYDRFRNYR